MVVVRSMITLRCIEGLMDACNRGINAFTRSTVSIMLAPGWRKITRTIPGPPLIKPALRTSSSESLTLATSDRRTGDPLCQVTMSGRYSFALNSWSLSATPQARSELLSWPFGRFELAELNTERTVSRLMP